MKKIMTIVAHADDETFGAGGTLANYGNEAVVLCLTGDKVRQDEFHQAIRKLGIEGEILTAADFSLEVKKETIELLVSFIQKHNPEIILTHSESDYHRDHQITNRLVKEAVEWASHVTQYGEKAWRVNLLFEIEINSLLPNPTKFVDITTSIERKKEAIRTYSTQLSKGFKTENYYEEFTVHKAKLRGLQAGVEFAEAFRQINLTWAGPFYPKTAKPYISSRF
ncbi:MAG: PIG-L deacetylase family protein [Promethearchaeota archaeon]